MPTYAITMLATGVGIPVLAAMNAAQVQLPWGTNAGWGQVLL